MNRTAAVAHRVVVLATVVAAWSSTGLARPGLTADFGHNAALSADGQVVTLSIRVRCPAGLNVLEAFVYVGQNGNQSQFAALPVTCDGRFHRQTVAVPAAEEFPFQAGSAQASGYILLEDPSTGATLSASPTETIQLR